MTTAPVATAPRVVPTGARSPVALLIRQRLVRDRVGLVVWAVAFAVIWGGMAGVVRSMFDDAGLVDFSRLAAANPAILFLRGAPQGGSLGSATMFSVDSFVGLMAGFFATLFAVRHTRGDEESGRTELVSATPIPRGAPLIATVCAGVLELALVSVVLVLSGLPLLPLAGNLTVGFGTFGTGLVFLGLGLVCAYVMPTSRSANGAAAALVLSAFLLRGTGDALGTVGTDGLTVTSAWPSWTSPLGWVQLAAPFGQPRTWILALYVVAAAAALAAAVALDRRHELGAALVPERKGRAHASRSLGSVPGLLVRTQRGTTAAWVFTAVVMGAVVGKLGPSVASSLSENPDIARVLEAMSGRGFDPIDTFSTAIIGFVTIIACAQTLLTVQRMRSDELHTGELLSSTRATRTGWFDASTVWSIATGIVVLLAAGLAAAASLASGGYGDHSGRAIVIALTNVPIVLVFGAIGLVLFGFVPRLLTVAWVLLFGLLLIGEFAPMFGSFRWLETVTPFHWVADPLAADPNWWPSVVMAVGSAVVIAAARAGFVRRDLGR